MSYIQSTVASAPHVPEVPMTNGARAWARAIMSWRHSDFVDAREYFEVPEPSE